jgi:hypothetical protein
MYEWHTLEWPREVEIVCPRCSSMALLDLAVFDYEHWSGNKPDLSSDPHRHFWNNVIVTERYPAIVRWSAPSGNQRPRRDMGVVRCSSCALIDRHDLSWPEDAYWKWDVADSTLWAWTRAHATAIRSYVAQALREASTFPEWEQSLRHLPKQFLAAKARDEVVRKIDRSLRAV